LQDAFMELIIIRIIMLIVRLVVLSKDDIPKNTALIASCKPVQ